MSLLENTIFKEDLAILNFIDIIEKGKNDFVLATEVEACCVPVKISFTECGVYKLDFQIKENVIKDMGNDFFFTHHVIIFAKGVHLLVQNKDIQGVSLITRISITINLAYRLT